MYSLIFYWTLWKIEIKGALASLFLVFILFFDKFNKSNLYKIREIYDNFPKILLQMESLYGPLCW